MFLKGANPPLEGRFNKLIKKKRKKLVFTALFFINLRLQTQTQIFINELFILTHDIYMCNSVSLLNDNW